MDRSLVCLQDGSPFLWVFKYVDDLFIVFQQTSGVEPSSQALPTKQVFEDHTGGLNFPHEIAQNDGIMFLGVFLDFKGASPCWMY